MPRVAEQYQERTRSALRNNYARQQDLAEDLNISRDTISRFFNGKSLSHTNFSEICRRLNLDMQEIAVWDIELEDETPILCNLPVRDYPHLIGRDDKLIELLRYISYDYRQHITVVNGIGGVGKTALILEVAYLCLKLKSGKYDSNIPIQNIPKFDAIIFCSAKDSYLFPCGVVRRPIREATLMDIFRVIAQTLDDRIIMLKRGSDQILQVYDRLKKQQTLLIIDNMETMTGRDRKEVLSFLCDLPESTQAVVTTRERIVLYSSIELDSLSEISSLELIKQQAKSKKVKLTKPQCKQIYYRFGGIPLALIYAVGQKANGYSIRRIIEPRTFLPKDRLTEDIARFCFERSIQPLKGTPTHRLLLALSIFTDAPIRDAVAEVAGLTTDPIAVEEGLARLEQLSLVREQEDRYKILPLTRVYASAELDTEQDFKEQAYERWVYWYIDFTNKHGGKDWQGWRQNYDNYLHPEWSNLEQVLNWCAANNRYESFKLLWLNLDTYLDLNGHWETQRNWWNWLLEKSRQRGDLSTYIKGLSEKAWILMLMRGDSQYEAEELLRTAYDLIDVADYETKIFLNIYRAVLYLRTRQYTQSLEYLNKAKSWIEESDLEERYKIRCQVLVSYYQGEVNYSQYDLEKAQIFFEEVIKKGNQIRWQRFVNYGQNWQGDILIKQGDYEKAEIILHSGLFVATENKETRRIGHYQASYARLEQKRGHLDKAKKWATKALKCFTKEEMTEDANKMYKLLDCLNS